jgi:phosphohistidine phosphatase
VRYVLVSGSARTRQTVACLALGVDVEPSRDLYGAGSPTILRAIRAVPDEVAALLVVGHSPGIPSLVDQLAGPGSDAEALRLASHFPPATLCRLEVSGAWADLDRGRLTHTYRTLLPSER